MTRINNYIMDTFDGMLVVGDVHGDYESFKKARDFAISENMFLMLLGDLVDRGRMPYEVVSSVHKMMFDGQAGLTVGNHDDKHYRAAHGNKVKFSRDAHQTNDDVGADRMSEFHKMYIEIVDDKMLSGLFHTFGDLTLVHAASHECIWEGVTTVGKTAKSRFLVGETNGEVYSDGYPVRLYNWIENVPIGKTVMVGHDKQPIHQIPITEPMTVVNKNGGKVVFLDTGCGKGGFLSGAVFMKAKQKLVFEEYKEFK